MAGAAWALDRAAIVDWTNLALAWMVAFLLFRYETNPTWLVLGGGACALLWRRMVG